MKKTIYHKQTLGEQLRALWRRRELIWTWVKFNIQSDYIDTKLGLVWLILNPLVTAGIITSTRGPKGGISLAKPPEEIRLDEVIQLLEGAIAPVECVNNPDACTWSQSCATREVWNELKHAMTGVLKSVTLRDLMERQKQKESASEAMYYI